MFLFSILVGEIEFLIGIEEAMKEISNIDRKVSTSIYINLNVPDISISEVQLTFFQSIEADCIQKKRSEWND